VKTCLLKQCLCGKKICQEDIEDHQIVCPNNKSCPLCKEAFKTVKELTVHYLNCLKNQVCCPYWMDGCESSFSRNLIEKHLDDKHSHQKSLNKIVLVGIGVEKIQESNDFQEPEEEDEVIEWCTVTTKVIHNTDS